MGGLRPEEDRPDDAGLGGYTVALSRTANSEAAAQLAGSRLCSHAGV